MPHLLNVYVFASLLPFLTFLCTEACFHFGRAGLGIIWWQSSEHFFFISHPMKPYWWLGLSDGGIYTPAIGKCYKQGLFCFSPRRAVVKYSPVHRSLVSRPLPDRRKVRTPENGCLASPLGGGSPESSLLV